MASGSLDEAVDAVISRLRADATLLAITGPDAGSGARAERGWPAELLEAPESNSFPRITAMRVATDIRGRGRGDVRVRLYFWSWDDIADLDAMEVRAVELLDTVHWDHNGVRCYAFSVEGSERSGREPRSRLHTFELHVT